MDPQQPTDFRMSDVMDDLKGLEPTKAVAAAKRALVWLDQNPAPGESGEMIWRLLERRNLGDDVAADTLARAFAWLDQNSGKYPTVTILVYLLGRTDLDPAAAADAVGRAFALLDDIGTTWDGSRILRALLDRRDLDPAATADVVSRAFAWLDHNRTRQDSGLILDRIVARIDLTPEQDAEATRRAQVWLEQYPSADYSAMLGISLRTRSGFYSSSAPVAAEHKGESEAPSPSSAAASGPEPLEPSASPDAEDDDNQANLLFRVYIPSERLYAAEADRLLSLFRDWLITTRGRGIRQAGYSTASGKMYEFFADTSVIQSDLQKEFDSFSSFLTLCATDTSAAANMLIPLGLGRVTGAEFVARISREVRQLQTDLTHERERRIMIIRHSIEKELVDSGTELRTIPRAGIQALIESLVPGPAAPDSLALLAAPQPVQMTAPVTVNIHPQIITAVESTIIQNIKGTVQLGPQANQLLELIGQFGGNQSRELESSVYELEDADAPVAARSAAKRRLKSFLGQIAGPVRDAAFKLLEKYIEDKLGL
jgi:hypothetical protein